MNPEQLKALQIKPDAKKRPERSSGLFSSESRWSLPWGRITPGRRSRRSDAFWKDKNKSRRHAGQQPSQRRATGHYCNSERQPGRPDGQRLYRQSRADRIEPALHRGGEMDLASARAIGCEGPGRGETG